MLYSFVQVQVIRKKLFLYFNIWIGDKFSCCFLVFFRFTSLRFYLIAFLKPSLMFINRIACNMGGSPGLVDDDSCSRGCGFESQRCILDGHIFSLICCKNCVVCLKRLKMNVKGAGVGPFLRKVDQIFQNLHKNNHSRF